MREFLEDVEMELLLLMHKFAAQFGLINPHSSEILSSADKDIERTLAAQGCMFAHTSWSTLSRVADPYADTRFVALRRTITSNEALP